MSIRRRVVLASIGFMIIAGCGWWMRITEVSGTVTVDGQPAEGVRVVFEPTIKDRPRALASTDSSGAYRLTRLGPGNKAGAPAGKYVVKVFGDTDDPNAPRIPAKYGMNSELTFDVVAGKPNVFDIEVSSK